MNKYYLNQNLVVSLYLDFGLRLRVCQNVRGICTEFVNYCTIYIQEGTISFVSFCSEIPIGAETSLPMGSGCNTFMWSSLFFLFLRLAEDVPLQWHVES